MSLARLALAALSFGVAVVALLARTKSPDLIAGISASSIRPGCR